MAFPTPLPLIPVGNERGEIPLIGWDLLATDVPRGGTVAARQHAGTTLTWLSLGGACAHSATVCWYNLRTTATTLAVQACVYPELLKDKLTSG